MKIRDFDNYIVKIKYFPEFQCPLYFGGGKFLGDCDIKSVIYSNLCNSDFLNQINESLENKISVDMDEEQVKLTNISIGNEFSDYAQELNEIDIPDGNHEGSLSVNFTINNEANIKTIMDIGTRDVKNKNLLESCSYIEIYEGMLFIKLKRIR